MTANLRTGPLEPVFLRHGPKCSRCGASILWAETPQRRRMPLDALPHVDGTVLVADTDDRVKCRVLTGFELEDTRQSVPGSLYVSHFATCPVPRGPRR